MKKPLDGLRVIDLTHVLAGPYCGYQLALLGADVIKVEAPRGDMTRLWGGNEKQLAAGLGSGFVPQNAGKRSAVIDIHTEEGARLIAELAAQADIFLENYRPGTMLKYGLDYESLKARNDKIIYASISAFGQDGPHGHRPGFDDVVQATSGFMSINQRGDGPIRTGGPVLDYATGMHATSAILAAVLMRHADQQSHRIDIAMQDVTMLLMNRNTSYAATTGTDLPPAGNQDGPMLGRFETADSYVMLAGYLPTHQRSLCRALGLDEFAEASGRELLERATELEETVSTTLKTKTSAEWDEIFSTAGVVGGGVRDICATLATGQPQARELLQTVSSPAGDFAVTSAGYKIDAEVMAPDGGLPQLGEHTAEVLLELGLSDAEIRELHAAGTVTCLSS